MPDPDTPDAEVPDDKNQTRRVIRKLPQFPSTHWSVVLSARDQNSSVASRAISDFCSDYWYPLYAYCRRTGKSVEEAEDLTQGFFANLISKDYLGSADPEKGRLRTFLIVAFKRFMANEWAKETAQKRGGGDRPVSLDVEFAENRYSKEAANKSDSPDVFFERQWALALLEQVVEKIRNEYRASGRGDVFEELKSSIVDGDTPPSAEVGQRLNLNEGAVRTATHRLRKRYREVLRASIANTVGPDGDVEEEIRHLFNLFRK